PSVSFWARCGPALSPALESRPRRAGRRAEAEQGGRGKGRDRSAAEGAVLCPQTPQRSPADGWETRRAVAASVGGSSRSEARGYGRSQGPYTIRRTPRAASPVARRMASA